MTQQIMDSKIINLEDYRTPKSKVFTGRDRGERVRLDSNIDFSISLKISCLSDGPPWNDIALKIALKNNL